MKYISVIIIILLCIQVTGCISDENEIYEAYEVRVLPANYPLEYGEYEITYAHSRVLIDGNETKVYKSCLWIQTWTKQFQLQNQSSPNWTIILWEIIPNEKYILITKGRVLDGKETLIWIIWDYRDEWKLATRNCCPKNGPLTDQRIKEIFWEIPLESQKE